MGSTGATTSTPAVTPERTATSTPVPSRGQHCEKCEDGMVLKAKDSCDYEVVMGTSISAEGVRHIVQEKRISVDSRGITYMDGGPLPDEYRKLQWVAGSDETEVLFAAYTQGDGTVFIEISESAEAPGCFAGVVLQPGDSCVSPTIREFYVRDDGYGCTGRGGSGCAGSGQTINDFSAKKNDDGTWTIVSGP